MTSRDIRQKYIQFFESRGHKEIEPAKLVLENDPTTLFTSAGMQPLVPYLLGENHPEGKRLVDSQPCFRSQDIEEVGDNRHITFFEMLGNWSLGDYFKKEQLPWVWEFLTQELKLPKDRLHISLFEGGDGVDKDSESFEIWKSVGVDESHIHFYDAKKNWWSLSGTPAQMKEGEIGGPDSEIFFEFTQVDHSKEFGEKCHPNCDCGRFLEIGNSVFIQYQKQSEGSLKELPNKNVDFGGGLERLLVAKNDDPDIFKIDLLLGIIEEIETFTGKKYTDSVNKPAMRIIADHLRAAVFLIVSGVVPANKLQGYLLRRLLRRSAIKVYELGGGLTDIPSLGAVAEEVLRVYDGEVGINRLEQRDLVEKIIVDEMSRFASSLDKGLKEVEKIQRIDGKKAFDLYQSFGFPYEITEELFRQKGQEIDREQFKAEFEKHKDLSRTASAGKFAGGLAGHSEVEVKYHTATHLLHQALRDVLGETVFQKGSNITPKRLRFDFSFNRKMTEEEIREVEDLVNEKIKEDLKVDRKYMTYVEAKALNAIGLFDEKYDKSNVSIYCIGPNYQLNSEAKDQRKRGEYYSLEFCGGPHVDNTRVIGAIKIVKEEAISQGIRRIRAQLS